MSSDQDRDPYDPQGRYGPIALDGSKTAGRAQPEPPVRVDHGWPWYFNCTVPGCTLDGHKCYKKGCTDRMHTHPNQPG